MIKYLIVIFAILFFYLVSGTSFLENHNLLEIQWGGYKIEADVFLLLSIMLTISLVINIFTKILSKIRAIFKKDNAKKLETQLKNQAKQSEDFEKTLIKTFANIYVKDRAKTREGLKIIQAKYQAKMPEAILLLSAEADFLEGKTIEAEQKLYELLNNGETKYYALKRIVEITKSRGDYAKALDFSMQIFDINKQDGRNISNIIELYKIYGNWLGLRTFLEKCLKIYEPSKLKMLHFFPKRQKTGRSVGAVNSLASQITSKDSNHTSTIINANMGGSISGNIGGDISGNVGLNVGSNMNFNRTSILKEVKQEYAFTIFKIALLEFFELPEEKRLGKENLHEIVAKLEYAIKNFDATQDVGTINLMKVFYANLLLKMGSFGKVAKFIEDLWQDFCNLELWQIYLRANLQDLLPSQLDDLEEMPIIEAGNQASAKEKQKPTSASIKKRATKQLLLAKKLYKRSPRAFFSKYVMAQSFCFTNNLNEAMKYAKQALSMRKSVSVCKLIAQIDLEKTGNKESYQNWLLKAEYAMLDASWMKLSTRETFDESLVAVAKISFLHDITFDFPNYQIIPPSHASNNMSHEKTGLSLRSSLAGGKILEGQTMETNIVKTNVNKY